MCSSAQPPHVPKALFRKSSVTKVRQPMYAAAGFQVCHSLGGGTGSGMGTLLISKIREEYPGV